MNAEETDEHDQRDRERQARRSARGLQARAEGVAEALVLVDEVVRREPEEREHDSAPTPQKIAPTPTKRRNTIANRIHSPQRSLVNALPIVGVLATGDHQRAR